MMNILSVAPSYYPATQWGGPVFFDYGMNNALAGMEGVNLKVLTTDAAKPKSSERLDVRHINHDNYINQEVAFTRRIAGESVSYGLICRLPSLIRWADVVRVSTTYSFPVIPVIILCRLYDRPLIWTLHGAILDAHVWPGAPRKGLKRFWELVCSVLLDKDRTVIHALSGLESKSAEERIPGIKTVVIPNGLRGYEPPSNRRFLPKGMMRLMYLGRLSPKKGIENLITAVSLLSDRSLFSLKIYGGGDMNYVNKLHRLVEELQLQDNISFMGEVVGGKKSDAFDNADVCIVPSHTESFCIVVAEALNHGVPVIASHGTPWQDLETRECGLWVDNQPATLARAINDIRLMPLADMGRRGREWMREDYVWETVANRMLVLCASLKN